MSLWNNSPASRTPAKPKSIYPETVTMADRPLKHSGRGRTAGSQLYIDLANARSHELFALRVQHVAPAFLLGESPDNPSLGVVRVLRASLAGGEPRQGSLVLAGPLKFDADQMPRMAHAWLLDAPPAPARPRLLGVLNRVHSSGNFGEITSTQGQAYFVHFSEMRQGAVPQVGGRFTFVESMGDRGPKALDVRPA